MMAFPYRYVALLEEIPSEPRELKAIKPAKKKDYLMLANILISIEPTEATRRAVEFLVGICSGSAGEGVPHLKWIEEDPAPISIEVTAPSSLGRICPLMPLRATLRE